MGTRARRLLVVVAAVGVLGPLGWLGMEVRTLREQVATLTAASQRQQGVLERVQQRLARDEMILLRLTRAQLGQSRAGSQEERP